LKALESTKPNMTNEEILQSTVRLMLEELPKHDISKELRLLKRCFHPDKNPATDTATRMMKILNRSKTAP
jgi:hypothetical protein